MVQVENERNLKIQQIIQKLMSEYNCPQVWKTDGEGGYGL